MSVWLDCMFRAPSIEIISLIRTAPRLSSLLRYDQRLPLLSPVAPLSLPLAPHMVRPGCETRCGGCVCRRWACVAQQDGIAVRETFPFGEQETRTQVQTAVVALSWDAKRHHRCRCREGRKTEGPGKRERAGTHVSHQVLAARVHTGRAHCRRDGRPAWR